VVGDKVPKGPIADVILDRIRKATAVIANLGGGDPEGEGRYNSNSCIEAGMAKGASVELYLVAQGPRKRAPFMVREEIKFYDTDAELLGIIHHLVAHYRRRIINAELSGT
jgi:hypothetical protein